MWVGTSGAMSLIPKAANRTDEVLLRLRSIIAIFPTKTIGFTTAGLTPLTTARRSNKRRPLSAGWPIRRSTTARCSPLRRATAPWRVVLFTRGTTEGSIQVLGSRWPSPWWHCLGALTSARSAGVGHGFEFVVSVPVGNLPLRGPHSSLRDLGRGKVGSAERDGARDNTTAAARRAGRIPWRFLKHPRTFCV